MFMLKHRETENVDPIRVLYFDVLSSTSEI